jgi:uncharacterized protein YndB with AHSA1/START domain
MGKGNTITVERVIAATAEQLFAMVSDLPRMGEWSPENTGGRWTKGSTGPGVGAKFEGDNRNGSKSWKTGSTVTAYDPDRRFAFSVDKPLKVADWAYSFDVVDGGCKVTETWTDQRGRLLRALGKPFSGVADREAHNRAGMEATLASLAAAAEAV